MHKGLKSGSGHHRLDKCGPPMAVTRYRKTALTSSPCCVFSPVLLMMHLIPSMRPIPSLVSSSGLLDGMTFFFIFSFLAFSFRLVVFCPVSSFLSFFVLSLSRLFISFFYLYLPFSYLLFFLTDQGYGRGGTPAFTGVFEPLARVALYPTDEDGLGTWFAAA